MEESPPITWAIKSLVKSFGEKPALRGVSFELHPGEILALLGEEGAGKTTLAKIMAGVFPPDAGEILHNDRPIEFHDPAAAHKAGVAVLFEEPALAMNLTVAENLHLGLDHPTGGGAILNWAAMRRSAGEQLEKLGLSINLAAYVDQLSPFEQRMVEFARAAYRQPSLMVMDEPAAGLGVDEIGALHALLRRAAGEGMSILYLSDRPEEALPLADCAAVMREGQAAAGSPAGKMKVIETISAMAGFDVSRGIPRIRQAPGQICLEARGLRTEQGGAPGADLRLHCGEVLGLAGPGAEGIARALAAMTPFTEGELLVNGRGVRFKNPGDAWLAGIAIGGPDRDAAGCLLHLEKPAGFSVAHVVERLQAPFLDMEKFGGFKMPRQSDIPIQSLRRTVRYLAGGGAEKKRIARWLSSRARVLILLEPTRGLEAGARLAFYRMIDDLAAARLGVILVDSNHTEMQALSDRIVEV